MRVTSAHTPAGALFSLSGVRVFGLNPAAQPPPPVAGLAVERAHDDARQANVSWQAPPAPLSLYLVRYGVAATALGESDLYHSFQVDGREMSVRIRALSVGVEYLFVVDALNEPTRQQIYYYLYMYLKLYACASRGPNSLPRAPPA